MIKPSEIKTNEKVAKCMALCTALEVEHGTGKLIGDPFDIVLFETSG